MLSLHSISLTLSLVLVIPWPWPTICACTCYRKSRCIYSKRPWCWTTCLINQLGWCLFHERCAYLMTIISTPITRRQSNAVQDKNQKESTPFFSILRFAKKSIHILLVVEVSEGTLLLSLVFLTFYITGACYMYPATYSLNGGHLLCSLRCMPEYVVREDV